MIRRLVTPIKNYKEHADGTFHLVNDDVFGYLEKTHFFPVTAVSLEKEVGAISHYQMMLEVSWAHKRNPAVDLVFAEDVAFIGLDNESLEDEDDDDDGDQLEDDDFDDVEDARGPELISVS